jgi:hypothetical protein
MFIYAFTTLFSSPALASDTSELEVAVLMLRLQAHADKLWWSGKAKNQPLANFYLHELEEGAETLEEAHVVEDGFDLSAAVTSMLTPTIEALETTVKAEKWGAFATEYDALVTACNSCHAASAHGYIQIQRPTQNRWSNQDFTAR